MRAEDAAPTTIDAYLALQPPELRQRLEALRALVHELAPEATERMAYGLPTFWLNGNLVHIGAFKAHVGLYPGAEGVAAFAAELGPWTHSKGAIQFPHDEPLPLELIRRIVLFRVEQARAQPRRRG